MGGIGGMLGLSGGAAGTGFAGPKMADLISTTDAAQLKAAYEQNQQAMDAQTKLLQALQSQQGIQNQSNVYNQLQGVVAGQGPNPGQAALNQATGQNVATQAALMAGQRGAGANVGLMARQAAMQGGNLQQQAVGQGATMQAQQSLNALGQAGGMANTMAGQQIGQTNQNTASQQAEQQILQNAAAAQNQSNVAMQSNVNNNNAQLAQQAMQSQKGMMGGLLGGLGSLAALTPMGAAASAVGGAMSGAMGKADGGMIESNGPQSHFGQYHKSMLSGGQVPGKAAVSGDSPKNDTVKAMLSPGEVVIPKSVMESKNPAENAASFVQAVLAKKRAGK